jgi:hypothetical protein
MARKRPKGPCVYCLKTDKEMTWDHVFPRSWYPDSTPLELAKWKVPCCAECNNKYSAIEEDLLLRLGMCTDHTRLPALGIGEKALRTIKPEFAKSEREREIRQRKRDKIKSEIIWTDSVPGRGLLPTLTPIPIDQSRPFAMIKIPEKGLKALGHKLLRGTTFVLEDAYIDKRHRISVVIARPQDVEFYDRIVHAHGETTHRGPGLIIHWARAHDDPLATLFMIDIWGTYRIYAAIEPAKS